MAKLGTQDTDEQLKPSREIKQRTFAYAPKRPEMTVLMYEKK